MHRPPLPQDNPWYSFSGADLTSGHMVLLGEPRKKSPVTPPGIDSGTARLVAQRLNHYANPGPCWKETTISNVKGVWVIAKWGPEPYYCCRMLERVYIGTVFHKLRQIWSK